MFFSGVVEEFVVLCEWGIGGGFLLGAERILFLGVRFCVFLGGVEGGERKNASYG